MGLLVGILLKTNIAVLEGGRVGVWVGGGTDSSRKVIDNNVFHDCGHKNYFGARIKTIMIFGLCTQNVVE